MEAIMTTQQSRMTKGTGRRTHWSTRQLATMALFVAIGVILSFIEFPLIPVADFLKYDASAVAALLSGFAYGPVAGCIVGVLIALIHAFDGNIAGGIMNSGIIIAFVLPASLAYKYLVKRPLQRRLSSAEDPYIKGNDRSASQGRPQSALVSNIILIASLLVSCVLMIAAAIGMNLVVTPIYMGVPREAVISLLIPAIIPFNIIKSIINSFLGFVLLKSLRRFLE
jgi:riboflavin transporter FmnP